MYNMEIKVLGFKARVEVIVISVIIGMLLCNLLAVVVLLKELYQDVARCCYWL